MTTGEPTDTGGSVSIAAAAAILGVTRRSIYNYIRAGLLTTVRRGVSQRVEQASIAAFTPPPRGPWGADRAPGAAEDDGMKRERKPKTPMQERRALETAEVVLEASGLRYMSQQIDGLALVLVLFAQNEMRRSQQPERSESEDA